MYGFPLIEWHSIQVNSDHRDKERLYLCLVDGTINKTSYISFGPTNISTVMIALNQITQYTTVAWHFLTQNSFSGVIYKHILLQYWSILTNFSCKYKLFYTIYIKLPIYKKFVHFLLRLIYFSEIIIQERCTFVWSFVLAL